MHARAFGHKSNDSTEIKINSSHSPDGTEKIIQAPDSEGDCTCIQYPSVGGEKEVFDWSKVVSLGTMRTMEQQATQKGGSVFLCRNMRHFDVRILVCRICDSIIKDNSGLAQNSVKNFNFHVLICLRYFIYGDTQMFQTWRHTNNIVSTIRCKQYCAVSSCSVLYM